MSAEVRLCSNSNRLTRYKDPNRYRQTPKTDYKSDQKADDLETGQSIQYGLSLEEKFFELQCQRVAQGFQYLRMDNRRGDRDLYKSGEQNISQRRGVERSVALTLAPYVTIVELTTGAKTGNSQSGQELSVTTYCKTHVIQSDKKPTEYFFAFCGKFNQMYEPMNMNFNTRFRGKTYLGFHNLGRV